jgi:hypothetical protein
VKVAMIAHVHPSGSNLASAVTRLLDEQAQVKKIPMGVRALPQPKRDEKPARFHAELCGPGDKVSRHRHLDELDGSFDG